MEAGGPRFASPAFYSCFESNTPQTPIDKLNHKLLQAYSGCGRWRGIEVSCRCRQVGHDLPHLLLCIKQPTNTHFAAHKQKPLKPRRQSLSCITCQSVKKHNLGAVAAECSIEEGWWTIEQWSHHILPGGSPAHSTSARLGLIESRGAKRGFRAPGLEQARAKTSFLAPGHLNPYLLTCLFFFAREILVGKSHYYLFAADTLMMRRTDSNGYSHPSQ